ncbi:phosphotransferase [Jiella sp. KSK16Y-1]|uniref:Phosphotransferase n=2 Tax=Jiella mangrovi TaxID=2821407 RepID=A0ABS4BGE1_9HYPH|nr:phosphotransferase [Jiella mangrovi]
MLDRLALDCGWSRETHGGVSVLVAGSNPEKYAALALRLGAASVHMLAPKSVSDARVRVMAERLGIPFVRSIGGPRQIADMPPSFVVVMSDPSWLGKTEPLMTERLKACLKVMRGRVFVRCDRARPALLAGRIFRTSLTKSARAVECGEILARLFHNVLMVRRPTPNAGDIWYRAEVSREAARVLSAIKHATPLDIGLSKGLNYIELVSVAGELKALKVVPRDSPIARLDDATFDQLMQTLSGVEPSILSRPEPIGPHYRGRGLDGLARLLVPYIDIDDTSKIDDATVLECLLKLRQVLRAAQESHVHGLREVSDRIPPFSLDEITDQARQTFEGLGLAEICRAAAIRMADYDRSLEDCVIHGDPHWGNIVKDKSGRYQFIDLDLMRTGTAFSDLLMGAATLDGPIEAMADALLRLEEEEGRLATRFDFDFTIMQFVGWLVVDKYQGWDTAPDKLRTVSEAIRKLDLLAQTRAGDPLDGGR